MSIYNDFIADFFADNIRRGAELCNEAMLQHLNWANRCYRSHEAKIIDPRYSYIISNFVNLSEEVKQQLIKYKNYIIYEHDHKYTPTRNPFVNPDGSKNPDGIVPNKFKINQDFYKNAKVVICQTDWHQKQLAKNLDCTLDNIHGSFYTNEDLELITKLRVIVPKKDKYAIFNDSPIIYLSNGSTYNQGNNIKNKNEAIQYCIDNKLKYVFIPRINDKILFWKTLGSFKHFVFFPDIPETCSRLIIEAKMLGVNVITNENSGAYHEDWFKLNGIDLIYHFQHVIIPQAIQLFRSYL